jgi:hypothetical protein
MRPCTAAAALASLAATAHIAAQELVTFTWSFTEVVANSTTPATGPLANNGVIDPGEAARIALAVAFSPPTGTPTTYTPFPPGNGIGLVDCLHRVNFDLFIGAGAQGSFGLITRLGVFNTSTAGTLAPEGVINASAGQFPLTSVPYRANPVLNIWRVVWTPDTYTQRVAHFTAAKAQAASGTGAALYIDFNNDPENPSLISKAVPADFGSLQIPVVPSPSTLVLLSLAAVAGVRRRR